MSTINTTTWNIDEHTRVKHAILERYLSAWIPILGRSHKELLYIDGFAGPGKYTNGEHGSPIVALNTARKYKNKSSYNVRLIFVEKRRTRANTLAKHLSECNTSRLAYEIKSGVEFESVWQELADEYKRNKKAIPPTFAFLDPFGWKGIPLSLLKEITNHSRCEIFLTFMYEELNRFLEHPDQVENFRELFGNDDWQQEIPKGDAATRKRYILNLYRSQLQEEVAKYVLYFEMKNANNATKYFLFHATNNLKGVEKMKESMWGLDPRGNYRFSDAADPGQGELFGCSPNYNRLEQLMFDKFEGSVATIQQIEEFVLAETPFCKTHFKRQILREAERTDPPKIEVVDPPIGRRIGAFSPPELRVRFLSRFPNKMDSEVLRFE